MTYWSDEKVAEAKRLRHEGLTNRQVGIRLGCSEDAVIGLWYRLAKGIAIGPRRPWYPEDWATLDRMESSYATILQIAKALHRAEATVQAKIKELRGPDYKRPRINPNNTHQLGPDRAQPHADDLAHCLAVVRANKGRGFAFGRGRSA